MVMKTEKNLKKNIRSVPSPETEIRMVVKTFFVLSEITSSS